VGLTGSGFVALRLIYLIFIRQGRRAQQDVGLEATVEDYVRDIFSHTPKGPPVPD
jgi:hypothetical protein